MKLKTNKKVIGLALSLVIAAVFLLINPVHAGWGNDILAGVCGAIVSALGWVLVQIMGILVYFAQYNGFITSAAVTNGWVIVRDVCNMFFVLILLVIAFATILQIEEYNYKKWLPKLILMAILINFSKMICGLLIDAAQIVMLTFVNSFKDIAGGNLTSALGIKNWQTMGDSVTGSDINWQVTASLLLAVIYVIISIVVITAMLAMIAMRIVMLWIYIVLSPLAYLMSAFPGGKKYAAQWWSQFTQNLVVGPVLAFFIWLSFTSLATFSSGQFETANTADTTSGLGTTNTCVGNACGYAASDVLVQFIIAIGMLLGGMKITQEIGGVAGSAAGAGMNKLNKMGKATMRGIGGAAGGIAGTVTGYNFAKRRYGDWQKKTKEKMQAKSDLVYETAKGGIKGVAKGSKNMIVSSFTRPEKTKMEKDKEKERYDLSTSNDQTLEKDGKKYKYDKDTNKYKYSKYTIKDGLVEEFAKGENGADITKMSDKETKSYEKSERKVIKKEEKKNKKDEEDRLYQAYTSGVYKDENGDNFDYNEETHTYQKDGKDATHKVKDPDGNVHEVAVQKMDRETARFKDGMNDGMKKSEALRSNIEQGKEADEQKIFEDAGVSTTELKRIMNDSGVNKNRRLAAAMTLAIKNGFKNNNHAAGRQDVSNAKDLIGNNDVVLKKFNEAVNKSTAHLNYDLESEKGKKEFKQGMDEGKIDGYGQDSSAYKSSALVKTLKDYSGFDFADNISRVSQKSAQHRNNVNDGLFEAKNQDLADGAPIFDKAKQELNAYAKLIARLSGNMKNAFSGSDGKFDEEAATKYMEIAKPSWLANFDTDQLKKDHDPQNPEHDNMVDSINRAMAKGIQVNNITSLEKTGANPDLVRRLLGAIEELGTPDQKTQVHDSNILQSINKIMPEK